jgi:hypothetical protein
MNTTVRVCFCVVLLAFSSTAPADLVNMCLAENAGLLIVGPETMRDGDWSTTAELLGTPGITMRTEITFPQCDIMYVGYSCHGRAWAYGQYGYAATWVELCLDGSWTSIAAADCKAYSIVVPEDQYDLVVTNDDNSGQGWQDVSGIRMSSIIDEYDTGSACASHCEIQAWGIPEPTVLSLLAMGGAVVIRRRYK